MFANLSEKSEYFMHISGGTVFLNVGGTIHQVRWETIDKFPKSRLQRLRFATTEGKYRNFEIMQYGNIDIHCNN